METTKISTSTEESEGFIEPSIESIWNKVEHVGSPVLAGYIAGSCGLLVGHPLDSLKVLLQTGGSSPSTSSGASPSNVSGQSPSTPVTASTSKVVNATASSGSINPSSTSPAGAPTRNISSVTASPNTKTIANITPKRSVLSLYAGISGPLLSFGAIQSINFALYDTFRRILYRQQQGEESGLPIDPNAYIYNDSLLNVAASSTMSGAIVSFLTSPLMTIKTKQQVMQWSMRKAARDTIQHQGGIRNFFSGFGAHFYCDCLGRGVYFTSYEFLKRQIIQQKQGKQHDSHSSSLQPFQISLIERIGCAITTGMVCSAFIFPMDVVRSKIYAQSALMPDRANPPSSLQLMRQLWRKDGVRPFFRGIGITVARSVPTAAVILPIYDITLEWLTRDQ